MQTGGMGRCKVTALAEAVGLSQSTLSQHLASWRDEGIVGTRRESQTIWYRIVDPRIEQLFSTHSELSCEPGQATLQSWRPRNMILTAQNLPWRISTPCLL
jgi:ArsR family transcriptional regulator